MRMIITSSLVGAIALGLSTVCAVSQEVTLRFQQIASAKAPVPRLFMEPWADKIESESGGRIKIEIYPHMQLGGKPPSMYDQIRDGVIDGGQAILSYTPGRFPEAEALELPFITGLSAEASSRAAWDYAQAHLVERFSDVHLLAVHMHGAGVIHKKGDPILSMDDFNGLKLRGPSRQASKLLEAAGATPVGMPIPAFAEALTKGIVDGGVTAFAIVPSLKLQELTDSHTLAGEERSLYNTVFIWAMSKSAYDDLPDDLKAVIDANSGIEVSAWAGRAMDEGDANGRAAAIANGNDVHVMDQDTLAKLMMVGDGVTKAWIAEVKAKGLDGAGMVADAKALVAKYSDD